MKTCDTKPFLESPSKNKMLKLSTENEEMMRTTREIKAIEFVPEGADVVDNLVAEQDNEEYLPSLTENLIVCDSCEFVAGKVPDLEYHAETIHMQKNCK